MIYDCDHFNDFSDSELESEIDDYNNLATYYIDVIDSGGDENFSVEEAQEQLSYVELELDALNAELENRIVKYNNAIYREPF